MDEEQIINFSSDAHGRADQLKRQINTLDHKGQELKHAFARKKQDVEHFQRENEDRVKDIAQDAYASIEAVVELLLSVPNGRRRLSRENTSIIARLEEAVVKFQTLTSTTAELKDSIGKLAGDYMNLGDEATNFAETLQTIVDGVVCEIQPAWDLRAQHESMRAQAASHEQEYNNDVNNARWERDESVGNAIASFFSNDARDNLHQAVRTAEHRRDNNLEHMRDAEQKTMLYYRHWILTRNVTAALLLLRKQVVQVGAAYDDEFKSITTVQDTKATLERGIRDLKNKIFSPDFESTRDNALKIIVDLLEADNHVFMGEAFYEETEERIKKSIRAKLGEDAVEKLAEPLPAGESVEEFELP